VLIGVPKKNGKPELAAALGLFFLLADGEPAPLVVCAAASEEQAYLGFEAAKTMCSLSPYLAAVTERFQKEILVPSIPGAKLKRVAAAAGTNDGQNIPAVICDELHEWTGDKGEKVWTVLTNATGARQQPLVLQITTAGYDLEGRSAASSTVTGAASGTASSPTRPSTSTGSRHRRSGTTGTPRCGSWPTRHTAS
jgi:phage terminase large subunit-like protein